MAKFKVNFSENYGRLSAGNSDFPTLGVDDLLETLRPAAMRLRDHYKETILKVFRRRTGSLSDSIDFEDDYMTGPGGYVSFTVKPEGTHKGGTYTRGSRAGSSDRKYAKHNRKVSTKKIKNNELAYLLEYGTPRIAASHWMESANEEIEEALQDMIEENFDRLLKEKGLI